MNYKFIIPECYGDTALIECLGFEDPNHQKGIGNVKKVLNKDFNDKKAICIIDNDKNLGRVFPNLKIERENSHLKMAVSQNGLHRFIVIKPALEKWLLTSAELSSIPLKEDYDLPNDFKELGYLIKNTEVDRNQDFIRFLKALKRANPEPIATLKSWLEEIVSSK